MTLSDVKGHLRLTETMDCHDPELIRAISDARDQFEKRTNTAVLRQTWIQELPSLKDVNELPYPPLATVESVMYVDRNGDPQTVDPVNYQVLTNHWPGLLARNRTYTWPTDVSGDLWYPWTITYTCGYALPVDVPAEIKNAVLFRIEEIWDNPEDDGVSRAFEAYVARNRVFAPY